MFVWGGGRQERERERFVYSMRSARRNLAADTMTVHCCAPLWVRCFWRRRARAWRPANGLYLAINVVGVGVVVSTMATPTRTTTALASSPPRSLAFTPHKHKRDETLARARAPLAKLFITVFFFAQTPHELREQQQQQQQQHRRGTTTTTPRDTTTSTIDDDDISNAGKPSSSSTQSCVVQSVYGMFCCFHDMNLHLNTKI